MLNKHIFTKMGISLVSVLTLAPIMLTSANADSVQSNTPNVSNVSSVSNENSDEGFDGGGYHLDFIGRDTYMSPYIKKHFYNNLSPKERAAKNYVAFQESSNAYNSYNAGHYGKFELEPRYLKWGKSKIGQEKAAEAYVKETYGTWINAARHEAKYHWYSMDE